MRRTLLLFALIIMATSMMAQLTLTTKSKKAKELFTEAKYSNSFTQREQYLLDAIKKDKYFIEAYWVLADDYNKREKGEQAAELLIIADGEKFERRQETLLYLAETYYLMGKYDLAVQTLEKVTDLNLTRQKNALSKKFMNALYLFENPTEFNPVCLDAVNTEFDNYFPSITADGSMISTTVQVEENTQHGKFSHEDIYQSINFKGEWQKAVPLDAPMNTPRNEGSQSFSADGRYMFFVSCDNRQNIGGCDMYYAIRRGFGWSNPINMGEPVNTMYWESNPVLSPTGDELYFISNRPGGLGESDIWRCKVKILDHGMLQFSAPENLGAPINTKGSEFAPFIHADNQTLYFSSNGIDGLGRGDIYMSKREGKGFSNPVNIGYPVNTHGDESGFVVNAAGTKAYYSSNKIDSTSNRLKIYEIDLPERLRPEPMIYFTGKIIDANTKKPLEARVEIYQLIDNAKQYESLSDAINGSFTAYLPPNGHYGVSITRPKYLFYTSPIENLDNVMIVEMQPFKDGNRTVIQNLFFDFNSAEILPESYATIERLYQFLKQNGRMKVTIEGHTDNIGTEKYNLELSKRRADAIRQALIEKGIKEDRIIARGMGRNNPIATNDTEEGRAQNRRVELVYGQEIEL